MRVKYVFRLIVGCVISILSFDALAFQTFMFQSSNEHRIKPNARKFQFYISDMYFDFQAQGLKPTNPLVIAIWRDAFDRLQEESGIPGLEYEFGGTYPSGMSQRLKSHAGSRWSDNKIYIDVTGSEHEGTTSDHAGAAYHVFSPSDPTQIVGGIEFFNSRVFDITHPNQTIENIIHHEQVHILGLDHSPFQSARMSYGNPVWSGLSSDDRQGLTHLFETGPKTEIKITAYIDDKPAQGVEVILIDPSTGRSYGLVTRFKSGEAVSRGIPAGQYLVAGRELTPSGPCFSFPASGFLTSFYVDDETATNQLESAGLVQLTAEEPLAIQLRLIEGTKRFDCYWAAATYTSERASQTNLPQSDWDTTWSTSSSARPRSYFGYQIYTDRDVLESKKTNTNSESGLHSSIEIGTIGTGNPISITEQGYDIALDDVWRERGIQAGNEEMNLIEARISSDATPGSYAGYCQADGEIALISQMLEIRANIEPVETILEKFPQFRQYMSDASLPKSIYEMNSAPLDNQSVKEDPVNFGIYMCGVLGPRQDSSLAWAMWFFLLPLLLPGLGRLLRI
jgi:hypothetical protein